MRSSAGTFLRSVLFSKGFPIVTISTHKDYGIDGHKSTVSFFLDDKFRKSFLDEAEYLKKKDACLYRVYSFFDKKGVGRWL